MPRCIVCDGAEAAPLRVVDGVAFHRCPACASLFADPEFIARVEAGAVVNYQAAYWESELHAAEERSYGSSLARVAEVFRMCRIPVRRFIDIGTGAGALLDAVQALLPELGERFHGIELFPPEPARRSRHPGYRIGTLADLTDSYDGGICIEVIEHLSPRMLRGMAAELALRATPGSLFYFNSAQPSFVASHDPGYLDPLGRGHIVSYSVQGAACLFRPAGFRVIELPGRDWAFLAEFTAETEPVGLDDLFTRLWTPNPENMASLAACRFGPLMVAIGMESARCYLEHGAGLR